MSKYIDADKVIDYANQEVTAAFYYPQNAQEQRKRDEQAHRDKWAFVKQVMVGMPAADVQEVKHGRWIRTDAYPHRIYCSNCYGTYALDHWGIWIDGSLPRAYCPNCGSRMDLGEETK